MSAAPVMSSSTEYAKVAQNADSPTVDPSQLRDVYRVDLMAENIKANGCKVPCLQFPDDLVRDSTHVATLLQHEVNMPVYVLADTSYSPCCVDEIAAQHVNGDIVFHFGSACLNPTKVLPAVYVRRKPVSTDVEALLQLISQKQSKVLLYPELDYTDLALEVVERSESDLVIAIPAPSSASVIPPFDSKAKLSATHNDLPNRALSRQMDNLSDYSLVYLTDSPSESLLLHWSTVFKDIDVVRTDGDHLDVNPALRRRYRYVQSVKSSGTIGILVNTLSLRDTANLLERTKQAITRAEKKYYMFVVGKPNVAKLGNFEAIDLWVVLGCPQGGVIMDDSEYSKPIVTPYELELAFRDDWTGKWLLDFNQVLVPQEESEQEASVTESSDTKDENEPLFDLVTGKFVFGNTPLRQVSHLDINDRELQTSSSELTIRNTVSTAAQKLQQRSWQGLGSDHSEITGEYAQLKKGRSGIARHYNETV